MSVLDKARELGEALYASPEFVACQTTQTAMESDPEASKILKDLAELEADIRLTMEKPEMEMFLKPKMERYQKMQADAGQNPKISAYQKAAQDFQNLMNQVNGVISFFLTGENPEESGCTHNCATCKGCAPKE